MDKYYTSEKNVQILISLLKEHKIKKIVASPGTTNLTFVASLQYDGSFEMYSAVDERSAAYMACGLAEESGEPVVITCTEATASRNYFSGLTEAYYRKLPILAVTGTRGNASVGNLIPQAIDRSSISKDIVRFSVEIPAVESEEDKWFCQLKINTALLELKRNGGGPAHINLCTSYSKDFSVKCLPEVNVINRITTEDQFPPIKKKKVAVYIGAHKRWKESDTLLLDLFCEKYDAVVLYDHTSGYKGKYGILFSLIGAQEQMDKSVYAPDLLIHFGEVMGGVYNIEPCEVWRVSPDGEIRDRFGKLTVVFEMSERQFLNRYAEAGAATELDMSYYARMKEAYNNLTDLMPELPFSNAWIAKNSSERLPDNSYVYLGILNTLRSWNFFETPESVEFVSNVGGYGIDGGMSALVGASLVNAQRLYFCIIGDLAFFYDMNVLGNRHAGNNLRILLINNGRGTEFKNYGHPGAAFGDLADDYIAAAGHFGNKSPELVKHYAGDLGFEYMSAETKQDFLQAADKFFSCSGGSMIFEVFTDSIFESEALKIIKNIIVDESVSKSMKKLAKRFLGETTVKKIKQLKK